MDSDVPSTSGAESRNTSLLDNDKDKKVCDKIAFVKAVEKYRSTLFVDHSGSGSSYQATMKEKEDAWKLIADEVSHLNSYKGRTWQRLRDHDWQYVRRHALNRYESKSPKIGGLIGVLDQLVLDVISGTSSSNRRSTQLDDFTEDCLTAAMASRDDSRRSRDSTSHEFSPGGIESMPVNVKTEFRFDPQMHAELLLPSNNDTLLSLLNSHTTPNEGNAQTQDSSADDCGQIECSASNSPANSLPQESPRKRLHSSIQSSHDARLKELEMRKLELQTTNLELEKIKLEKEIKFLEDQEKRSTELHLFELKKAKLSLARMESLLSE